MKFLKLRVDEAILPYMNGDDLTTVPEYLKGHCIIEYTLNFQVYRSELPSGSTWGDIFSG